MIAGIGAETLTPSRPLIYPPWTTIRRFVEANLPPAISIPPGLGVWLLRDEEDMLPLNLAALDSLAGLANLWA